MIRLRLKSDPVEPSFYVVEEVSYRKDRARRLRPASRSPVWRPPTDLYQEEGGFVVRAEIAGMGEADFTITLDGRRLSIGGTRADKPGRKAFHRMEIHFGEFRTEVDLPADVDAEGVEGLYKDGFLRISLPIAGPRKIEVE